MSSSSLGLMADNDRLALAFVAGVLLLAGCCPSDWLPPLLAFLAIWAVGTFCRNMERQQQQRQMSTDPPADTPADVGSEPAETPEHSDPEPKQAENDDQANANSDAESDDAEHGAADQSR